MKSLKSLFFLFIVFTILQSCYYDVEEKLYPGVPECDTTNVTLSGTVRPILVNNCYVCHSTAAAPNSGEEIDLESYSAPKGLKNYVNNGQLKHSINHTGGLPPMPQGITQKLPACDIMKIEKWIALGAKND